MVLARNSAGTLQEITIVSIHSPPVTVPRPNITKITAIRHTAAGRA